MKIKVDVSEENYHRVREILEQCGLEEDENADFLLTENKKYAERLQAKDSKTGDRVFLPMNDIVLIESFGHNVEVHTEKKCYQAFDRLYKVVNLLDPEKFLRISNSVIIATDKVKQISPTLSMKFILTMTNGEKVDVTRSYYYIFKEFFDI